METVTTAHAAQQQCCESEATSHVGLVKNVTRPGYGKKCMYNTKAMTTVTILKYKIVLTVCTVVSINKVRKGKIRNKRIRNRSISKSSRSDRIRIHNPAQHGTGLGSTGWASPFLRVAHVRLNPARMHHHKNGLGEFRRKTLLGKKYRRKEIRKL
jgi:hypothetical protein